MKFESEKTGQHLRTKALNEGHEGRMRALHALNHGYGTGSRAALANMLLAALGGQTETGNPVAEQQGDMLDQLTATHVAQVADPYQESANDSQHALKEISTSG